jgi:hypothetical protein
VPVNVSAELEGVHKSWDVHIKGLDSGDGLVLDRRSQVVRNSRERSWTKNQIGDAATYRDKRGFLGHSYPAYRRILYRLHTSYEFH